MAAETTTIVDVFGSDVKILTKDGEVNLSSFAGKYVGIYFSAHWCPPCRGFTPKLANYYKKVKEAGIDFEIIFASSDKTQDAFNNYYNEMPWCALPYEERTMKAKLAKQFKVSGIPMLVLLDPQGELYNEKGRGIVDKPVSEFPWAPPTLGSIFSNDLEIVDKQGNTSTWGDLDGKTVGIYVSAHWCPPCRAFTPELVKRYAKAEEQGKDFEIVFSSWDKTQSQFEEYFNEMPWKAIPYSNEATRNHIGDVFNVSGIPCLIILDNSTGGEPEIIRANATGPVRTDTNLDEYPWVKSPISDLSKDYEGIDELPSIILMQEAENEDNRNATSAMLMEIGVEQQELAKNRKYNCFTANQSCNILNRVRQLTGVNGTHMVLLDLQDSGAYYKTNLPNSVDDIRSFLSGYENKSIDKQQCSR